MSAVKVVSGMCPECRCRGLIQEGAAIWCPRCGHVVRVTIIGTEPRGQADSSREDPVRRT